MATPAALYRARNAALKLVQVVQPLAQSGIPLANEATTESRAVVKVAADEAIVAAIAIGGTGPVVPGPDPMPATRAMVDHSAFTQVLNYRGANAYQGIGNLIVENNKLLAVTIPANFTMLKTGTRLQINNAQYTFTIVNGDITAISVIQF